MLLFGQFKIHTYTLVSVVKLDLFQTSDICEVVKVVHRNWSDNNCIIIYMAVHTTYY